MNKLFLVLTLLFNFNVFAAPTTVSITSPRLITLHFRSFSQIDVTQPESFSYGYGYILGTGAHRMIGRGSAMFNVGGLVSGLNMTQNNKITLILPPGNTNCLNLAVSSQSTGKIMSHVAPTASSQTVQMAIWVSAGSLKYDPATGETGLHVGTSSGIRCMIMPTNTSPEP